MSLTAEQTTRYNYLKKLVALRIDEYTEGETIPDVPAGDLSIELENATRSIIKRADRNALLGIATKLADPVLIDKDYSSIVPLPDTVLRFLQVKGTAWEQPTTVLIGNNANAYKEQIYAMKRATKDNPLAFLVPYIHENGRRGIELFPKDSLDTQGMIVVEEIPSYDMPVEFEDAIVWRTTASILVILNSSKVNAVFGLAEAAIQEIGTVAI